MEYIHSHPVNSDESEGCPNVNADPVDSPPSTVACRRPAIVDLPFVARLSPHVASANRHCARWMTEMALVSSAEELVRLDRWDVGFITACCYPDADPEAMEVLVDWITYWMVYDDQFDTPAGPARPDVVASVMEMTLAVACAEPGDNPYPDVPFCDGLADLMRRIAGVGLSATWSAHFRETIRGMLRGFFQQSLDHARDAQLDVRELLVRRRLDIAMQHLFDLVALVQRWEVPDSVRCTVEFSEMHNALNEAMAMYNDVYSAYRDRGQSSARYNTVLVLEKSGQSEDQALASVRDLIQRRFDRYLTLKAELPEQLILLGLDDGTRAGVQRYLQGTEDCFAGAELLQRVTDRYNAEARYSPEVPNFISDWGFTRHTRASRRW